MKEQTRTTVVQINEGEIGKLPKKEFRIMIVRKWKWSRSVVSNSLRPHGHQAPLSMGFSRQEYWSGLPFPSPGTYILKEGQIENEWLVHQEWPEDEEIRFEVQEIQTEFWWLI